MFQSQKLALHLVALLKRTSQPPEVQRMVLNKCRIAVAKEDAAAAVERVVVHLSVWQHRVEDDDLALLRVAGPSRDEPGSQDEPGRGSEESPRCARLRVDGQASRAVEVVVDGRASVGVGGGRCAREVGLPSAALGRLACTGGREAAVRAVAGLRRRARRCGSPSPTSELR